MKVELRHGLTSSWQILRRADLRGQQRVDALAQRRVAPAGHSLEPVPVENLDARSAQKDYVRGFGYQGSAGRDNWARGIKELSAFGADLKADLIAPGQWRFGMGSWGECLPYHENRMFLSDALRDKFGRRVQLRGNTLIGFSEGAYVAMNVGVREPEVFNRWLILAANDGYWGGEGQDELEKRYAHIKRVYLLTGEHDEVVGCTRRVFQLLDDAGVHVMMKIPEDLAHEIPEDRMRTLYRRPLRWLNSTD